MQMEAIKAALQDLLSAMDGEDKRVLKEKLAGPKVEVEVEGEEMEPAPCEKCGDGACSCGIEKE